MGYHAHAPSPLPNFSSRLRVHWEAVYEQRRMEVRQKHRGNLQRPRRRRHLRDVLDTLKSLLEQAKILDIYTYISWPLALICFNMKQAGVTMNGSRVKELRADYGARIREHEAAIPEPLKPYYVTKRKRRSLHPKGPLNENGKPSSTSTTSTMEKVDPWR